MHLTDSRKILDSRQIRRQPPPPPPANLLRHRPNKAIPHSNCCACAQNLPSSESPFIVRSIEKYQELCVINKKRNPLTKTTTTRNGETVVEESRGENLKSEEEEKLNCTL